MLKNKKGFTLVELLVAIAIMISITVVAIISITKISEQNKKQAYELVKEQVKTAALEYFSANEYLFEGLINAEGKITAKRLVDEGYLNTLINPITGEKLNGCDYIEVSKIDGKYNYTFKTDESLTCPDNSYIITKEAEDPEVEISKACNNVGNGGWCIDTETVTLNVKKGNISQVQYDLNSDITNGPLFMTSIDNKTYYFEDKNNSPDESGTEFQISIPGTSINLSEKYYIDNIQPEFSYISKIYGTGNNKIKLSVEEKEEPEKKATMDTINSSEYSIAEGDTDDWKVEGTIGELENYDGSWINRNIIVIPYATKSGPSGVEFECHYASASAPNEKKSESTEAINEIFSRKTVNGTWKCKAISGAGKESSELSKNLRVDKDLPSCNIKENNNNNVKSSYEQSTNVTFKLNETDSGGSGLSSYSISTSTIGTISSNKSSLPLSSISGNSFSLYGKVVDNAGNENTCSTGTIAVNTGSDCSIRVVANDSSKKVNGWYNIATGQPIIQSIVEDKVVDTQYAREGTITYSFASGYQCKNKPSAVTVKYDRTVPSVNLIMKKKNSSSNLSSSSSIARLSDYTNEEIYNGYVFTRTSYTAGPSDATVSCTRTKRNHLRDSSDQTLNFNVNGQNINEEGVTTIRCTATSGAGVKSSEITKTIKLERNLKMVLDESFMREVKAKNTCYDKPVFNSDKTGIAYYSTSNKMNCTDCKIGNPNSEENYGYIGTACKNVGDFERKFIVSSPIGNSFRPSLRDDETQFQGANGTIYDDQTKKRSKKNCSLGSNFTTSCGDDANGTQPNFTIHNYYYEANSGAKSNEVILYTKYTVGCGYPSNDSAC